VRLGQLQASATLTVLDETWVAPGRSDVRMPGEPESPNVTASIAASSASMVITMSPSQAAATVGAGVAPRSASAAILSGDRLYAVTWWPADNKLTAMPDPMLPRPMNPILMTTTMP